MNSSDLACQWLVATIEFARLTFWTGQCHSDRGWRDHHVSAAHLLHACLLIAAPWRHWCEAVHVSVGLRAGSRTRQATRHAHCVLQYSVLHRF